MRVEVGDVIFSHPKELGFYSKAVRFFTKSKWSHCFFIMTDVAGERTVLEADIECQVVPFYKEYVAKAKDVYEVYRPIKASKEELAAQANKVYWEYSGETYGFLQIPWFTWDALCSKLGWESGKNWFPSGAICSEVLAAFQSGINLEYAAAHAHLLDLNRISPEMLYKVVKSRPDLFEYVGSSSDGQS